MSRRERHPGGGTRRLVASAASRMPQPLVDLLYRHRFNPAMRVGRSLVARALGDARDGVPITRGPLAGYRFAFSDSFAMWIGGHEPAVLDAILREVRPGQIVYDIGAHVGYTVLLLARAVGSTGRVIAFEPDPTNLDLLHRNIELNGLSSFVEARGVALGHEVSSGSLRRRELSILTRVHSDPTGGIPVSTLDFEVFDRGSPPPDLVVMDVEGSEKPVLQGARRVLETFAPTLVCEHEGQRDEIIVMLGEIGYAATDIDRGHILLRRAR